MERDEFLQLFEDIRDAIKAKIEENTEPGTKVVGRNLFDENESTWVGLLADENGETHCWTVFYTGCAGLDAEQVPTATEVYVPTYRIVGYRAYQRGTDDNNSSDKHVREVNTLRWEFMNDPRLGLDEHVRQHTGFIDQTVISKIDTRAVHITRVDMGVELLPISYDFPA